MPPFVSGFIFGAITSLFFLVSATLALSFTTAGFISALLAGVICVILVVWLGGAAAFWRSFQDGSKLNLAQSLKDVGYSLLWPIWIGIFAIGLMLG